MPRYCAVKCCRNRGGTSSKRENKRISFYPFPLQDKSRLQRWVNNIQREEWTPSRHQYLCSEHFTEDCFDIRWGIRYLKSCAIPTLFAHRQQEEGNTTSLDMNSAARATTHDPDSGSGVYLSTRPVTPHRTSDPPHGHTTKNMAAPGDAVLQDLAQTEPVSVGPQQVSDTVAASPAPTAAPDGEDATRCCVAPESVGVEPLQEQAGTALTTQCNKSPKLYSHSHRDTNSSVPLSAAGQTVCVLPHEMVQEDPEEEDTGQGEHVGVQEHSYCRPDTDKEHLWNKILTLHAKIVTLVRTERSTVAKIQALETEIALLKRDGAGFREKQRVLEDYISSVLI